MNDHSVGGGNTLSVSETLEKFTERMEENPEHIKDLTYTYEFHITDEKEGIYQLHIQDGKAVYYTAQVKEPRLVLEMDSDHFLKLADNNLNAAMAYMSGRLKINGEVSHALKFQSLLKKYQQ
jgi:putative sterol carrier protein